MKMTLVRKSKHDCEIANSGAGLQVPASFFDSLLKEPLIGRHAYNAAEGANHVGFREAGKIHQFGETDIPVQIRAQILFDLSDTRVLTSFQLGCLGVCMAQEKTWLWRGYSWTNLTVRKHSRWGISGTVQERVMVAAMISRVCHEEENCVSRKGRPQQKPR